MRYLIVFFGLFVNFAQAEDKKSPPDSMPLKAAQDLDYAIYVRNRKAQKVIDKYQKLLEEELKQAIKAEVEVVQAIEKKYSLRLFDEKGQPIDKVDYETGKITRKK